MVNKSKQMRDKTEQQLRGYYAAWLREAIGETGMPQAELGRRVGLERDQVNRLLTGKRVWDPKTVEAMARALRVPRPVVPHTNDMKFLAAAE